MNICGRSHTCEYCPTAIYNGCQDTGGRAYYVKRKIQMLLLIVAIIMIMVAAIVAMAHAESETPSNVSEVYVSHQNAETITVKVCVTDGNNDCLPGCWMARVIRPGSVAVISIQHCYLEGNDYE